MGSRCLKRHCDTLLSSSAFKLSSRRYTKAVLTDAASSAGVGAGAGTLAGDENVLVSVASSQFPALLQYRISEFNRP